MWFDSTAPPEPVLHHFFERQARSRTVTHSGHPWYTAFVRIVVINMFDWSIRFGARPVSQNLWNDHTTRLAEPSE